MKFESFLEVYDKIANSFMSTVNRWETDQTVARKGLVSLMFFKLQSNDLLYELSEYMHIPVYLVSLGKFP